MSSLLDQFFSLFNGLAHYAKDVARLDADPRWRKVEHEYLRVYHNVAHPITLCDFEEGTDWKLSYKGDKIAGNRIKLSWHYDENLNLDQLEADAKKLTFAGRRATAVLREEFVR